MKKLYSLTAICICLISVKTQAQTISTFAGGSGDTAAATTTQLYDPTGISKDFFGNIYIADNANNRVRKIDTNGVITIFAGNGQIGFSGDGGPATSAQLYWPSRIATDTAGNVYIADWGNNRVRKVDKKGIISTIAGNGTAGFAGDGGLATDAELNSAYCISIDTHGNLFIADGGNNRIRKIGVNGIITTVAGNGTAGFAGDGAAATAAELNYPICTATDTLGNLYIADEYNRRVRKVDVNGMITTFAGNGSSFGIPGDGGAATAAVLPGPVSVAADFAGNVFISDNLNYRVRKVNTSGIITTVAGNGTYGYNGDGGPAVSAELGSPLCVVPDTAGNLFIADAAYSRIRKVSTTGIISTIAGNRVLGGHGGYSGPAIAALLGGVSGVAIDSAGNVYITDFGNNQILKVDKTGIIRLVAGSGTPGFSGDGGPALSAQLNQPTYICADVAGNLYINDMLNNRVRKISTSGVITTIAGNGKYGYAGDSGDATSAEFNNISGLATDVYGNVYVMDIGNNRLRKIDATGIITTIAGNSIRGFAGDGGPASSALLTLGSGTGIASDIHGNIYFSDGGNNRIRKIDTSGIISTLAGNGVAGFGGDGGPATSALLYPASGIVADAAGNLYVSDRINQCVRKVAVDGIINTVAGNRTGGFYGDGGPALLAEFYYPVGITMDSTGSIYIADGGNYRIRKITPQTILPITLVSFTGSLQKTGTLLNWQTMQEVNTRFYTIERSTTGTGFISIGRVNAKGNSNIPQGYSYTDYNAQLLGAPTLYYRLAIINNDGSLTYSRVIALNANDAAAPPRLQVYPNPAINTAQVQLSGFTGRIAIIVTTLTGKIVLQKNDLTNGNIVLLLNNLPAGIYIVNAKSAAFSKTVKLLKAD